jgi:rod shape-determining protein MreC
MMVTSGAGGYYRPGVAVAVIAKITPDGGIARLVAEPSATNFVSVLPVHQPEAVEELEAPEGARAAAPGAAASPSPAASADTAEE